MYTFRNVKNCFFLNKKTGKMVISLFLIIIKISRLFLIDRLQFNIYVIHLKNVLA